MGLNKQERRVQYIAHHAAYLSLGGIQEFQGVISSTLRRSLEVPSLAMVFEFDGLWYKSELD